MGVSAFGALYCGPAGRLWIELLTPPGTADNLATYERGRFTRLDTRDRAGALWFARFGEGLACWEHHQVTLFSTAQGLLTATINGLIEDTQGIVWMTSKVGVYRISQDELQKLAGGDATQVRWRRFTKRDGDLLRLQLEDDGAGFDAAAAEQRGPGLGLGLTGMAERVKLAGGTFDLALTPGTGTRVRIILPLPPTESSAR